MARVNSTSKYPPAEKRPRSLFERTRSEDLEDGVWDTLYSVIGESPSKETDESLNEETDKKRTDKAEESPSEEEHDVENDPDWREDYLSSSDASGNEQTEEKQTKNVLAGKKRTRKQLNTSGKKRKKETSQIPKINATKSEKKLKTLKTTTCKECNVEVSDMKSHKKEIMHKQAKMRTKKKYECTVCKKGFTLSGLRVHMENHEKDAANQNEFGEYYCGNCAVRYDDFYKFRAHRHHFCPLTVDNIEEHHNTGTEGDKMEESITCKTCGKIFKSMTSWRVHNLNIHRKKLEHRFTCHKCGKYYYSYQRLQDHDTFAHINEGKATFKCHICAKLLRTPESLQYHMNRHTHPQIREKCEHCPMIFTSKTSLYCHVTRNHKFKLCEHCGQYLKKRDYWSQNHTCRKLRREIPKIVKKINGKDEYVKFEPHKQSALDGADDQDKICNTIDENNLESTGHYGLKEEIRNNVPGSQHVPKQIYPCPKCPITFEVLSNLESHKDKCEGGGSATDVIKGRTKTEQEELSTCEICQFTVGKPTLLCLHELQEHHWLKCEFCEELVPDDSTLQMHKILECPEKYGNVGTPSPRVTGESNSDIQTSVLEDVCESELSTSSRRVRSLKRYKFSNTKRRKKLTCNICGGFGEDADCLQLHLSTHTVHYNKPTKSHETRLLIIDKKKEKYFDVTDKKHCNDCKNIFSSEEAAEKHKSVVASASALYPKTCGLCEGNECEGVAHTECELLQHNKLFKYKCQFCSQHFPSKPGFLHHLTASHDLKDMKRCTGCNQVFGSQTLQRHIDHSKTMLENFECKCLSCGVVFENVDKLNEHDTQFRSLTCRICSQHFMKLSDFKHHRRTGHNLNINKWPALHYECKHCQQPFTKVSELSAHVKLVMLESQEAGVMPCAWENKLATCFGCGMSFQNEKDLDMHKAVWRYRCDYCHKHFRTRSDFILHLREHVDEQTFGLNLKCKYCKELFHAEFLKTKHEINAVFEKSHSCEKCGKIIQASCQFSNHKKKCRKRQKKKRRDEIRLRKVIGEICIICRARIPIGNERLDHLKQHNTNGELTCGFCAKSFESVYSYEFRQHSNTLKQVNTMCTICKSRLTTLCQIPAHVESCIKGKTCGMCLKEIESDTALHQRFTHASRDVAEDELVGYQCEGCDMFMEANCIKKYHEAQYSYVCQKCKRHFQSFDELVGHLTYSASQWETCITSGHKVFICSYCREVVETEEQKYEHDDMFVFRCQQCKMHFNTALEMVYHFKYTHDDCYKCDSSLVSFLDVLAFYLENASCERRQDNQVVSSRGGETHQIGDQSFYVYPNSVKPQDGLKSTISMRYDRRNMYRSEGRIMYTCRRCSFTTLTYAVYEAARHESFHSDCTVCFHCSKRFYGQYAGKERKQHEMSCAPKRYEIFNENLNRRVRNALHLDADSELCNTNDTYIARDMFVYVKENENRASGSCPKKQDVMEVKIVEKNTENIAKKRVAINRKKKRSQKGHRNTENDVKIQTCLEDKMREPSVEEEHADDKQENSKAQINVRLDTGNYIKGHSCFEEGSTLEDNMTEEQADDKQKNNEAQNELLSQDIGEDALESKDVSEPFSLDTVVGKRKRKKVVRFDPNAEIYNGPPSKCASKLFSWKTVRKLSAKSDGKCNEKSVTKSNVKSVRRSSVKSVRKSSVSVKVEVEVYTCSCSEEFAFYSDFIRHWNKNYFKNIRCVCTQCDTEFELACLAAHHLQQYSHYCKSCKVHFDKAHKLQEHMYDCKKCKYCRDTQFREWEEKERHKAWHKIHWIEHKSNTDVPIIVRDPLIHDDIEMSKLSTKYDNSIGNNQSQVCIDDQATSNKEEEAPIGTISAPILEKEEVTPRGVPAKTDDNIPTSAPMLEKEIAPINVPPSDADINEDDDVSGIEINWGGPLSSISIPKHKSIDVEITFEGRKLPFKVDAAEARAVILTLLNENIQDTDEIAETQPGTKEHDKKWMFVNIPQNLVATSSLRFLRCIIAPNSLPGLDEGTTVMLSCVSLLPAMADGMVTIFVPTVRSPKVTEDNTPVSGRCTDSSMGNIDGSHNESTMTKASIDALNCYDVQQCVETVSEDGENILVFHVPEKCVGTYTPFVELYPNRHGTNVLFSVIITSHNDHDDSFEKVKTSSLKVLIGQRDVDSVVKHVNLCGQLTLSIVLKGRAFESHNITMSHNALSR